MSAPLLDIRGFSVDIRARDGRRTRVLDGVDLTLHKGETLGVLGQSGSGKTMLALSIMGLLPSPAEPSGAVIFDGKPLGEQTEADLCAMRGGRIGMVFQEPATALNPVMTVGDQIAEAIVLHHGRSWADARKAAIALLDEMKIPDAARRAGAYPHELSGGQRQRVGIAIALAPEPVLLIADEPTTALDVTVQADILDLIADSVRERQMTMMLVSHDPGVIARSCMRAMVLDRGRPVEQGPTAELLRDPQTPYTRTLLAAFPKRRTRPASRDIEPGDPVLDIRDVTRIFRAKPDIRAVDGVSLSVERGTIHGIVGESGSGKSTLARIATLLDTADRGTVTIGGLDPATLSPRKINGLRRDVQMVFQDPYGSLDPRWTVGRIIAEPLHLLDIRPGKAETRDRVLDMLESVGLDAHHAERLPHEFSGGQRQRIAIARALITAPKLVVADEPVSALDLQVQAQVLDLILDLRDTRGVTFLFISHDLGVIDSICDRVSVMHRGRIVEEGQTRSVFDTPQDPYTQRLVHAARATRI